MKKIFLFIFINILLWNIYCEENILGTWELEVEYSQNIQIDKVQFPGISEKQILLVPNQIISKKLYNEEMGVTLIEFVNDTDAFLYVPMLKGRIKVAYKSYEHNIVLDNGKKIKIIHIVFKQNRSFVLALNMTKENNKEYRFTYMIQAGTFGLPYNNPERLNVIGKMVKK